MNRIWCSKGIKFMWVETVDVPQVKAGTSFIPPSKKMYALNVLYKKYGFDQQKWSLQRFLFDTEFSAKNKIALFKNGYCDHCNSIENCVLHTIDHARLKQRVLDKVNNKSNDKATDKNKEVFTG